MNEIPGIEENNMETISVYELGRAGVGIVEEQNKILRKAAADLVKAVETYTAPKKGEFMRRTELLIIKDRLKKML